jgi:hypothetical protein
MAVVLVLAGSAHGDQPRNMWESLVSLKSQLNNDQPAVQVKRALASCRVTRDDRNGWIQVVWPDGPVETVALWTSASGDRIFGHVVEAQNPEAEEGLTFWSYSKEKSRWVLREGILPDIDLRDFWDDSRPPPDERSRSIALRYALPRKGTTILATLDGPYDAESAFYLTEGTPPELEAHVVAVRAAKYKRLELLWDRRTGRFSKGKREP